MMLKLVIGLLVMEVDKVADEMTDMLANRTDFNGVTLTIGDIYE